MILGGLAQRRLGLARLRRFLPRRRLALGVLALDFQPRHLDPRGGLALLALDAAVVAPDVERHHDDGEHDEKVIGVPTDKAYFYPEGVEGLFEIYYAPADTFETVNTLGLPLYARMIPDRDRDEWVRLEIESNPLPICTRPQVLRSARRT